MWELDQRQDKLKKNFKGSKKKKKKRKQKNRKILWKKKKREIDLVVEFTHLLPVKKSDRNSFKSFEKLKIRKYRRKKVVRK